MCVRTNVHNKYTTNAASRSPNRELCGSKDSEQKNSMSIALKRLLNTIAGVGSVDIMKLLYEAWGADIHLNIWEYSVYQHALNSVSKGLADEKALDWLQIKGANVDINVNSKIGKYLKEFVDIKEAREKKIADAKLEATKKKKRDKKRARRKKAL